jgi:FKBP-type peptidyl-prolyl cis-trans isomerase
MTTAKPGNKVKIHYTATFDNGKVYDSSRDRQPLQFVARLSKVLMRVLLGWK